MKLRQKRKCPGAKTQLLKAEPALWTFITTVGVEPTKNAAERALRPKDLSLTITSISLLVAEIVVV